MDKEENEENNLKSLSLREFFDNSLPSFDVIYIVVALGVLYFSTRVLRAGTSHIFALILVYILFQKIQQKEKDGFNTFNEQMDYKLSILNTPSHFHLDTNFINLFYDIYDWRKKNANNFHHAMKAANNVLKIENDTEKNLQRCTDNYEIAFEQAKLSLNMMHTFVYTLEHPLLVKKLKRVIARLQQLLYRHLDQIKNNCESTENKKNGRDSHSRDIDDITGPLPHDVHSNSNFEIY